MARTFDLICDAIPHALLRRHPILKLHRKRPPRHLDDRRIAQELRNGGRIERRTHHDDFQIRPDRLADFAQQRDGQIDVERAFVKLIKHDAANPIKKRIAHELARENPFGDDAQPRAIGDAFVEANVIANVIAAERHATLIRDSGGRRPRGNTPRLKHHELRMSKIIEQSRIENRRRHARGFAGAGFGNEHERAVRSQRFDDAWEEVVDRERGHRRSRGNISCGSGYQPESSRPGGPCHGSCRAQCFCKRDPKNAAANAITITSTNAGPTGTDGQCTWTP